jgi:hypothetical protein
MFLPRRSEGVIENLTSLLIFVLPNITYFIKQRKT